MSEIHAAVTIQCIVEGHGEQTGAAEVVIRRIAQQLDPTRRVRMPQPIRVSRSKLISRGHVVDGEVGKVIKLASPRAGSSGAVIILLDADKDCPAEIGPQLLASATRARSDVRIAVILAKVEFEAWFLAAAESLRGVAGLASNLSAPSNPEGIHDCKGWLSERMAQRYSPTLHQTILARSFDLRAARRADSFDKFYRDVERLLSPSQAR